VALDLAVSAFFPLFFFLLFVFPFLASREESIASIGLSLRARPWVWARLASCGRKERSSPEKEQALGPLFQRAAANESSALQLFLQAFQSHSF